jgi:hypothetical protein
MIDGKIGSVVKMESYLLLGIEVGMDILLGYKEGIRMMEGNDVASGLKAGFLVAIRSTYSCPHRSTRRHGRYYGRTFGTMSGKSVSAFFRILTF